MTKENETWGRIVRRKIYSSVNEGDHWRIRTAVQLKRLHDEDEPLGLR